MPGKYKSKYGDEYESDDFEATDTLIGRNRVPASPNKKKSRPASANLKKKSPRRPVTPGKKKKRPQSAPSARTGHDLWMNAVRQRLTVGLASNRHPQSPRHKTVNEFWIDTLRKTGSGITTSSTGMNTFSGKRPVDKDMPYLSTSSYLRQMAGTERPPKTNDPTLKASPGTPAYKSQEEYYEQILEYKKQVTALNQESSNIKAKMRRLEEDNLKKEKEIDSLLNPQKSEELRRTLADKRPDSGSVIHSLKQKILKLETQMRDKESAYIKLQSDLKTTKVDEMKQQMEVFYSEIVRLQNSKDTGMDKNRPSSRESNVKVKALNETILRLNKTNEQLQSENRSLKEDLKNAIEDHGGKSHSSKVNSPRKTYTIPGLKRDYEDMNRKGLLQSITLLEKKLERAEKHMEGSSIVSYESKAAHVQGKIALDGGLEDRLDQLDKRESELLELIEKKNEKIKQLTSEKNRWKKRCEEMERHVGSGTGDYDYRIDERIEKVSRSRPPSARTGSSRGQRPSSARSDDRPSTARERTPRGRPEQPDSGRTEKRPLSAKRRPSLESGISASRKQKIRDFQENRSAKTIQRHWKAHHQDQEKKDESVKEQEKLVKQTAEMSLLTMNNKENIQSLRQSYKAENTHGKGSHEMHLNLSLPLYCKSEHKNEEGQHASMSHKVKHANEIDLHAEHLKSSLSNLHKPEHTIRKGPHATLSHKLEHTNGGHAATSDKLKHTNSDSPHSSLPHKLVRANGRDVHEADRKGKGAVDEHSSDESLKLGASKLQNEKVEKFRENCAAKKIQHRWTGYQYRKHEREQDEAADLIRSALMGHTTRRQQMATYHDDTEDDYFTDNEEYNDCVNLIQSSLLGHQQRKSRMRDFHLSSAGEEDYDDDDTDIIESPKRRLSSSQRSNRPPSPSLHRSRPQSGKSRSSISSGKGSSSFNTSYKGRGPYSSHLDDDDDF